MVPRRLVVFSSGIGLDLVPLGCTMTECCLSFIWFDLCGCSWESGPTWPALRLYGLAESVELRYLWLIMIWHFVILAFWSSGKEISATYIIAFLSFGNVLRSTLENPILDSHVGAL